LSRLSIPDVEASESELRGRLTAILRATPRFPGHGPSIDALRHSTQQVGGFHIAFDVIASGDEDVVSSKRAQEIRDQTGAACVAWEGSACGACGSVSMALTRWKSAP
jgi:hypothetical protein